MSEPVVTTTHFWEQESIAPAHHLHAALDVLNPRIVVVAAGETAPAHSRSSFWDQAIGELVKNWLSVTGGDIHRPEGIHFFSLPSEPAVDYAGLNRPGMLKQFPNARLIVLLGDKAHQLILRGKRKATIEETVRAYDEFLPFFPLPHPSATEDDWLRANPWFEQTILQILRRCVSLALEKDRL